MLPCLLHHKTLSNKFIITEVYYALFSLLISFYFHNVFVSNAVIDGHSHFISIYGSIFVKNQYDNTLDTRIILVIVWFTLLIYNYFIVSISSALLMMILINSRLLNLTENPTVNCLRILVFVQHLSIFLHYYIFINIQIHKQMLLCYNFFLW